MFNFTNLVRPFLQANQASYLAVRQPLCTRFWRCPQNVLIYLHSNLLKNSNKFALMLFQLIQLI